VVRFEKTLWTPKFVVIIFSPFVPADFLWYGEGNEIMETNGMKEVAAFPWHDRFKLGYGPMDETHEEFVEIVNSMLTCPESALIQHLEAFAAHAEKHFSEELAWMKTSDFPNTDCHVEQHDEVLRSVYEVLAYLKKGGRLSEVRRLAQALAEWFPGHADYLDSALAQWLVKKKAGGVPIVLRRNVVFTAT
jgi:hemerythrin